MYEEELIGLSKAGAMYLVIGGIAVNLSGYSRLTFDLDIFPNLESDNLEKIICVLEGLGYKPRVPVNPRELKDSEKRRIWHEEKNMQVFSFINPNDVKNTVDLMIYPPIDFEEAYGRRQVVKIRGTEISIASIDDLIRLKEIAGRDKDKEALKVLRKLKERIEDEKD